MTQPKSTYSPFPIIDVMKRLRIYIVTAPVVALGLLLALLLAPEAVLLFTGPHGYFVDANGTQLGRCVITREASILNTSYYSPDGSLLGYCRSRLGPGSSGDTGWCSSEVVGERVCRAGGPVELCTGRTGWNERYSCVTSPWLPHPA